MQSATNKSIANKVIIQALLGYNCPEGTHAALGLLADNAITAHQLLHVLMGLAVFLMLIGRAERKDSEISSCD